MSLSGDLNHLPIVDVIQLMHSSRQSGILNVSGRKGKSQLVFKNGYIVNANHLDNKIRIGEILIARGMVGQAELDRALELQKTAGAARKPLLVTMIEAGLVQDQEAHAGLKELVETAIVEILTWQSGSFTLEANLSQSEEEYRFYEENLDNEIYVATQAVLMDALRVFDEKVRDGLLELEEEAADAEITADLLGLADLDQLDRKIPGVYMGLRDQRSDKADPGDEESPPQDNLVRRLNDFILSLAEREAPPEVATAVLGYVGDIFPRALTLVAGRGSLIAERSLGIRSDGPGQVSAPLGFRISLEAPSPLREAAEGGIVFYGGIDSPVLQQQLFAKIGAPAHPQILLLPVRSSRKTIFIIYADHGQEPLRPIPGDLLEMLAGQASQALTKILDRKVLEQYSL